MRQGRQRTMGARWVAVVVWALLTGALYAQDAAAPAVLPDPAPGTPATLAKVTHIIVLYMENRSFDCLLGTFPGVDGLSNVKYSATQTDVHGKPYEVLPTLERPFARPENPELVRETPELANLPNKPFAIDGCMPGVTYATYTHDLVHAFYSNRAQIHGGRMDRFAAWSDAHALTMGYYSAAAMEDTNLWRLAHKYVLCDRFFQGAFGGSFLNHQWLICGQTPVWPNPPAELRAQLAPDGTPLVENPLVPAKEGDYAVNTLQSVYLHQGTDKKKLLPPQTAVTIGDTLTKKQVDWCWYAGGWRLANKTDRTPAEEHDFSVLHFQYHHQPFAYFKRFDPTTADGWAEREKHLKDYDDFVAAIDAGTLPPVSFYKPAGIYNQHPGYANIPLGDKHLGELVDRLNHSPLKQSFLLIVTYDEFGGSWDHVPPPMGPDAGARADRWGPGPRIPTLVISPLIAGHVIDHTAYDTTSILKLITERFNLEPLPSPRAAAVTSLSHVLLPSPAK